MLGEAANAGCEFELRFEVAAERDPGAIVLARGEFLNERGGAAKSECSAETFALLALPGDQKDARFELRGEAVLGFVAAQIAGHFRVRGEGGCQDG